MDAQVLEDGYTLFFDSTPTTPDVAHIEKVATTPANEATHIKSPGTTSLTSASTFSTEALPQRTHNMAEAMTHDMALRNDSLPSPATSPPSEPHVQTTTPQPKSRIENFVSSVKGLLGKSKGKKDGKGTNDVREKVSAGFRNGNCAVGSWKLAKENEPAVVNAKRTRVWLQNFFDKVDSSVERYMSCDADAPNRPLWVYKHKHSENCSTHLLNARTLCRRLKGDVLVIGDSMSHGFALSLAAEMSATPTKARPNFPGVHEAYARCSAPASGGTCYIDTTFDICGGKFKLVRVSLKKEFSSFPLISAFAKHFHLVVFNLGAWYHIDKLEEYKKAISFFSQLFNDSLVVGDTSNISSNSSANVTVSKQQLLYWRPTVPGHAHCMDYRVGEPYTSAGSVARDEMRRASWHNSDIFNHLNKLAWDVLKPLGWRLLDIYDATALRRDSHVGANGNDCLHYCVPGPQSHWVRVLYNDIMAMGTKSS